MLPFPTTYVGCGLSLLESWRISTVTFTSDERCCVQYINRVPLLQVDTHITSEMTAIVGHYSTSNAGVCVQRISTITYYSCGKERVTCAQ